MIPTESMKMLEESAAKIEASDAAIIMVFNKDQLTFSRHCNASQMVAAARLLKEEAKALFEKETGT